MKKKSSRRTNKRLNLPKAGLLLLSIFVVGFGIYLLKLQSEAATFSGPAYPPGHPGWFYDRNTRTDYVFADHASIDTIHPAGSIFTARYFINTPTSSPAGKPIHVNIYLVFLKSQVQLIPNSFSCGTFAPCVPIVAMYAYPDRQSIDVCFDIPPSRLGIQNAYLFSAQFKQINTSGDNTHHTLTRWFKGECKANQHEDELASWGVTNPNFLGHGRAGNGLGVGGAGPAVPANTGSGPGNTGDTSGNSGQTSGAAPSSGGGGTSASNQSIQPNPLPTSSHQGVAEQAEIEPSPFFDGKLFVAGSTSSDIANTVSIGSVRLGFGWVYLGSAVVLLGVTGFVGCKNRRQIVSRLRVLHLKR